jgi:hypothetical protein
MIRKLVLVFSGVMVASAAQAALFSNVASFTSGPTTQLGTITNSTLTINSFFNGFDVSGQVTISVPPGAQSGTLLQWIVDRPLDPLYLPASSSLSTTTNLTGYSQPPSVGTFGNTSGQSYTFFDQYPVTSKSTIPLALVAGAATWTNLTNTSTSFTYTVGGTQYVRQVFDLDGIQLSGPGGNWIVDFPVSTIVNGVPEPTTMSLLATGLVAVIRRRRG